MLSVVDGFAFVEDPKPESLLVEASVAIQDDKTGGDNALLEEAALDKGLEEEEEEELLAPAGTMLGLRSGGAGGGRFKSE